MAHEITAISGTVTEVFAHRFVVATSGGHVLADLGPKGAGQIVLQTGDRVDLSGEMKPSELKVTHIARNGERAVVLDKEKSPTEDADPSAALTTAERNGFAVLGAPRRKPKHFEMLGRDRAGDLVELHIELDGALRKTKPVVSDDSKWAEESKL